QDCHLAFGGGSDRPAEDLAAWCRELRDQQIESLAAVDDEMMEAFVEFDGDVPRVVIEGALQRAVAAGKVMPLVAGSAKTGIGIEALQEVVHEFIPPGDGKALVESLGVSLFGGVFFDTVPPFVGWAFAVRAPAHGGERHVEVRILDGTLSRGDEVKFAGSSHKEAFTIPKVLIHGARGELVECPTAGPGDLVVLPAPGWLDHKALGAHGLTLCDAHRPVGTSPAILPLGEAGAAAEAAGCSFALQLEGLDKKEQRRLLDALEALQREDDGLALRVSQCGEHVLSCTGPLHLELVRERLAEDFKIMQLRLGKPQVEYQATLKNPTKAKGSHVPTGKVKMRKGIIHHGGGGAPDAWVTVEIVPGARDSGVEVEVVGQGACQ
ncbi:unnamed protein product, partial [Prorocentrum cordatum]